MNQQYRTTASSLRVRRTGMIVRDNIITSIPRGTLVTEKDNSLYQGWLYIDVVLNNKTVSGYIYATYAEPVDTPAPAVTETQIKEVHLPVEGKNISLNMTHGRAYPLNQPGMPNKEGTTPIEKINSIYRIINFLDVETSLRYRPKGGLTFCNIYAYDFCHRSLCYMPRVWWTGKAIQKLSAGETVPVQYGETVIELNANSLYDWFNEFGDDFGWERFFDLDEIQSEVNKGKTGIIVAKRKQTNRSGHIVAVLPETDDYRAERINGKVIKPLQSQAGVKNKRIFTSNWFYSNLFSGFAYWAHD